MICSEVTWGASNWISCSAELAFDSGCQYGLGFFNNFFVIWVCSFKKQTVGIGRFIEDLDSHVVDHVDYRLNLIGVIHVARQVIVDFPEGKESLFLTLDDKTL